MLIGRVGGGLGEGEGGYAKGWGDGGGGRRSAAWSGAESSIFVSCAERWFMPSVVGAYSN